MYDMNEVATAQLNLRRRMDRRGWLTLAAAAAALLVVLLLITAACKARSDSLAAAAGTGATETPSGAASEPGGGGGQQSGLGSNSDGDAGGGDPGGPGGNPGGGPGGQNPGDPGNENPGDDPGNENPDSDPDDPDQEQPEPLSIEANLNSAVPGGQCFASGTIAVSGGAYPVTVHYQWRRTALVNGQLTYVAVSPVRNITFNAPGAQSIQVNNIPPNGENIWFAVTGPKTLTSNWVNYDTCGGNPGDIASNG